MNFLEIMGLIFLVLILIVVIVVLWTIFIEKRHVENIVKKFEGGKEE